MKQVVDNQRFVLFSIGHGVRAITDFIHLLQQYKISIVVDVRTFPYSRFNPQYRRSQLEAELKATGIRYIFLGELLGGLQDTSNKFNTLKKERLNYEQVKTTAKFKEGIDKVIALAKQNIKVTLMCSESDQNQCHRKHLLAEEIVKCGIDVFHITKNGGLEKHIGNVSLFD